MFLSTPKCDNWITTWRGLHTQKFEGCYVLLKNILASLIYIERMDGWRWMKIIHRNILSFFRMSTSGISRLQACSGWDLARSGSIWLSRDPMNANHAPTIGSAPPRWIAFFALRNAEFNLWQSVFSILYNVGTRQILGGGPRQGWGISKNRSVRERSF